MGAASIIREISEAAHRIQPACPASSFYANVALTGLLKVLKLGSCAVRTRSCSAPVYDAEPVIKLHEATPSAHSLAMPFSSTSFTFSANGAPDPGRGCSAPRPCSSSPSAARVILEALRAISPAPPLPSACSADYARPWTLGHDTGPAVKIRGRASSVSNLWGCALRVEGFGDGSSGESPQPFTTTSTQRSRIDCLPSAATTSSTIRTSTTPSADLPHKAPRLPPVHASSAV